MNQIENISSSESNPSEEQLLLPEEPVTGEAHDEPQRKENKHKQVYDAFLLELEQIPDPESKLQKAIDFMEASLSQNTSPHFKGFWDARTLALDFFKLNLNPVVRSTLWAKYTELSKEARRIREILEEQSAFAAEQIELAITALEGEIANGAQALQPVESTEVACESLKHALADYARIQQELSLLNVHAARVNGLRKELIKTEMRIRQKNKYFQRLSSIGDQVFPKRKELIKELSQRFIQDVDRFIAQSFGSDGCPFTLFELRDEIKALQSAAKVLTLNTHAFTHTRLKLSECWDKIKDAEKERKKERAQQRTLHKSNCQEVEQKIEALTKEFSEGNLSLDDAQKSLQDIAYFMRQIDLGRDEVNYLRDKMKDARRPIADKQQEKEDERRRHEEERLKAEQEKEAARRENYLQLQGECEGLFARAGSFDADALVKERDALNEKIASSQLLKGEKIALERLLKPMRDLISEKKEQALLALSDDDRELLTNLKELLKQKKERRTEVKNQIETLRKAIGGSGLDFEKAMNYNEQLAIEKESLERINQSITEIEEKIDHVEA